MSMSKEQVKARFLSDFVAADIYDSTYLFAEDGRVCGVLSGPGAHERGKEPKADLVCVDYEDTESGGFAMCVRCFVRLITESLGDTENGMLLTVTAERDWTVWEQAGTWPLLAPRGEYLHGSWEHYTEEGK